MIYLRLFWEFFKVGLFSVGGGLATLPFLYSLGAKTGWFSTADVANMLAVSESTPGPSASTWRPMRALTAPAFSEASWRRSALSPRA